MSAETQPGIRVTDDGLLITDAKISATEVREYFDGVEKSDRHDELERILRLGVATVELASTTGEEEYVERKFEEMRREFEGEIERIEEELEAKFGDGGDVPEVFEEHLGDDGSLRSHLEQAFAEDGMFADRLDEELGEDGDRIQAALDPDRDGTPTNRLRSTFREEIRAVREKIEEEIAAQEAEQAVREQTHLKGEDFEETIDELLSELVYGTSHEFEFTGDSEGELTDRKVGDFVLELGETGQRIVIEAKSDRSYSQPDIKEELDDAIENRDADYGFIVFECEEYVPDKVGYFHEFNTDRLAVALSESDDTDQIEPGYFRIAFNWARTRAIQQYAETDSDFDPESVQASLDGVEASIDRFSTIRRKTTSIVETANEIDSQLEEIETEAKEQLAEVRGELRSAN